MSDFASDSPRLPLHLTDTIFEHEEEEEISDTMWSRLHQAANGQILLNSKDAEVIMAAFQKTLENGEREKEFLKAGTGNEVDYLSRRRNEIVISMKQQLMTPRSGDNDHDDVLKYLTSHYLPMAVLTEELEEREESDSRGNSPNQDMDKVEKRDSLSSGGGEVSCVCTQVNGREYKIYANGEPSPVGEVNDWFMSSELQDYLLNITNWEFDVFGLKKLTKWPLRVVGIAAAREIKMFDRNEFNEKKFDSFLVDISRSYCKNPYHNALHAADVVQTCLHFLTKGQLLEASGISALATAGLLIAAAVHDVGHPGSNNHFLTATSAPLAIQYNDHSPLENMHLATAFSLMQKPANNFAEALSPQVRKELRRIIIAMVLATDNDRHFGMHGQLEALVNAQRAGSGVDGSDDSFVGTLTRKKSSNTLISQSEVVINNNNNNTTQIPKTPISSGSQRSSFTQISPMNTNDDAYNDNGSQKSIHSRRESGSALSSRRNSTTIDDDAYSVTGMRRRASGVSPVLEEAFRILMASQKELDGDECDPELSPMSREVPPETSFADNRASLRMPLPASRRQSASMLSRESSGLNSRTPPQPIITRNRQPSVNSMSSGLERHGSGMSIDRAGTPAYHNHHLPSDAIQVLLLESALHMADISNPVKPWEIYQKWLNRVMEEFYHQGDLERSLDMPITFGFDRNNPIPQPKFQLGFMKVIVSPLYVTYSRLPGMNLGHCLVSMNKNIDHWTQMESPDPVNSALRSLFSIVEQEH